jgi:hypothetical protein
MLVADEEVQKQALLGGRSVQSTMSEYWAWVPTNLLQGPGAMSYMHWLHDNIQTPLQTHSRYNALKSDLNALRHPKVCELNALN